MIKDLVKEEEFHIAIGLNLVEEMKPKELLETNQRANLPGESSSKLLVEDKALRESLGSLLSAVLRAKLLAASCFSCFEASLPLNELPKSSSKLLKLFVLLQAEEQLKTKTLHFGTQSCVSIHDELKKCTLASKMAVSLRWKQVFEGQMKKSVKFGKMSTFVYISSWSFSTSLMDLLKLSKSGC